MEKCKLPQVKAGLIQAREVINNIRELDVKPKTYTRMDGEKNVM